MRNPLISPRSRLYASRLNAASLHLLRCMGQTPSLYHDECAEAHYLLCGRDLSINRAVCLLLRHRYVDEAGVLVLAQMEGCFYSLDIGRDRTRARQWLTHRLEGKAPEPNLRDRIARYFKSRRKRRATPIFHKLYRNLSWIKHANPLGYEYYEYRDEDDERSDAHHYLLNSCGLLRETFAVLAGSFSREIDSNTAARRALEHWQDVLDRWSDFCAGLRE